MRISLTNADGRSLARRLIYALLGQEAAQELQSKLSNTTLSDDLAAIYPQVILAAFNIDCIIPLCTLVIDKAADKAIWNAVFDLIAQTKPTRLPTTPPNSGPGFASAFRNTPNTFNSGGFQNTSEPVERVRDVLKWELNSNLELDHPDFIATYLGEIPQVEDAATAVFDKCCEGEDPLYTTGYTWRGWEERDEKGVQRSLEECVSTFMKFLDKAGIEPPSQRRFVPSPNNPIPGWVKRKPDLCVATCAGESKIASWRQVLVPIELKPSGQDGLERTWSDVMKLAREIFRHQDSRRFVLGLTLCGSTMRLWEFDRLGATTSVVFDIHKNGPFFVKTLLSFLWMNDEQLGFDPDLMGVDGQRFVKINRDGKEERLIITETLRDHAACIAGRATTCWKAYREGDRSHKPLVVKDSWQYVDRPEEGELIRKATAAGVTNISQYYHHETVWFNGKEDYIRSNVRNGMSTECGSNPFTRPDLFSPETTTSSKASSFSEVVKSSQGSTPVLARPSRASHSPELVRPHCTRSFGSASQQSQTSQKRPSSRIEALKPARKRSRSIMTPKEGEDRLGKDRVRRRIITQSVGKHLHKASCPAAIITGLLGGIKGELISDLSICVANECRARVSIPGWYTPPGYITWEYPP